MNKTVRKLRPTDYWRIGEQESWLQDMAAQGLHLKKMGLRFAHFTKSVPKAMKYRVEVVMDKKVSPEQVEMYADSGWDFVTAYQYFQVYSSPMEREAPELHTDAAEQAFTLEALGKRLLFNAVIVGLSFLLAIGMLASIWFLDGTPTYVFIEGFVIQQTVLALLFIYLTYSSLQAALSIRTLRKHMAAGTPINHHAPWKKHRRIHSGLALLFILVAAASAILPFMQLAKSYTKSLVDAPADLPVVRLAEIEQNPLLDQDASSYMIDGVDWANHYSFNWSPVAPVQYESDETGVVPGKSWHDGSGDYSPSLHSKVYKLRLPSLADNLIADLIKRHNYEYSAEDFIETEHVDFDVLIILEDAEVKEVYAAKDDAVIFVRYFGYTAMDTVIQQTEAAMKRISKE